MAPSFTRRLRQETPSWVRDGVVTAQQAETILARYPEAGRWFQRPIVVFSVLGGALVVLAVALLVAHNWYEIPRWAKLAGVLTLLLGAHAGGLVLRARGHGLMGEGFLVLGGGLLLVGIGLIGQLYNLAGRESDAVLLWWALLLPAAYVLPSIALIVLGWFGASAWFWMFVLDRTTWLGRDIYSNASLGAVAFGAAGVLVWAVGALHGDGEFRRARQLIEQLGLLTILVAMVPLGFLRQLGAWWSSGEATRWPLAVLVLLGLAAVAVGAASFRLPHDRPIVRAGLAAALLLVLLYLFAVTLQLIHRAAADVFRVLGWTNWAILLVVALALILYGARWDRSAWINWGVIWIGVDAVARYVELVGTMLQASALFAATGLFVLALGGALELLRRRVTARAMAPRGSA
jgi:uncharacterized membrane protein